MYVYIYKVTYPNGKIYIGSDVTDDLLYFGSVNTRIVQQDFTREQMRNFTIQKQVIWESETATKSEVLKQESALIRAYGANDPQVGYNRWPRYRSKQ